MLSCMKNALSYTLSASRRLFITFSPSLNLKFSLMKTHFKFVLQKDCLDDLSYAIMYETTKLAYRVSEDDVTRACNQVSTIAPILRSLFALVIQCEKWNLAFACMIC